MSVRFQNAHVEKMPLNIRIQWNAGTTCVSECMLKTLACRGFRVGPPKNVFTGDLGHFLDISLIFDHGSLFLDFPINRPVQRKMNQKIHRPHPPTLTNDQGIFLVPFLVQNLECKLECAQHSVFVAC